MHCISQLSLKCGLLKFGENGEESVSSDLLQLHMRRTFQPHLFLEQKRDGTMKGHLVAGGNKQHQITSKYDVGSPTCASESIILTEVINSAQHWDVTTVDIPNAGLQANVQETIYLCLRGSLC